MGSSAILFVVNFLLASKILTPLLQPLGFSLFCLFCGLALRTLRRTAVSRFGGALLIFGLAVLYLSSVRPVAMSLMRSLEADYPPIAIDELPESTAIVVLGGGILNPNVPRIEVEFNDHGDRLHFAAKLFKAGKAPRIIISGGNVFTEPGMLSNGEYSTLLLLEWGVDPEAIVVEGESRTTYENARNTARLLDTDSGPVLLVTSAFHMRRSQALFKAQGLDVVPASTDIQSTKTDVPAILDWIPDAYFLYTTSRAVKEYVGYIVYGLRGWL